MSEYIHKDHNVTALLYDLVFLAKYLRVVFDHVSPTYMGEFYINNGIIGLVIGMIALGVFARWFDKWIFKASGNWLKVVFVLNILWLEAFVGTTILVFIKTFLMFIFCLYILSLFTKRTGVT